MDLRAYRRGGKINAAGLGGAAKPATVALAHGVGAALLGSLQ